MVLRGICVVMLGFISSCALPSSGRVAERESKVKEAPAVESNAVVMRWSVIPPRDANGVSEAELENVTRQAFAGWQQAGVVRFVKAEPGEKADVLIGFGGAPEDANNKHAMAWSYPPGSPNAGLIRLSSDIGWTTNPWVFWKQPVQWVLGNRVGHVLGLQDNRKYDSIMSAQFPPREEPSIWDLLDLRKRFQHPDTLEGQ